MDALTKRSAIISTALHAALVAWTFWGASNGVSSIPQLSTEHEKTEKPEERSAPETELILVPESVPEDGGTPALPSLPAVDQKQYLMRMDRLPATASLIAPGKTEQPRRMDSSGKKGGASPNGLELPKSPEPARALSRQLQGRAENPSLDRAERVRRTAATHLDSRLYAVYQDHWRREYDARITNRQLVVRMQVDRRGLVLDAGLANSTGVPELDRLIELWLKKPGLGLPPLEPGVTHHFLVSLK